MKFIIERNLDIEPSLKPFIKRIEFETYDDLDINDFDELVKILAFSVFQWDAYERLYGDES